MMVPEVSPKPRDLVDNLYSDYNSLYVSREPTVRKRASKNILTHSFFFYQNTRSILSVANFLFTFELDN